MNGNLGSQMCEDVPIASPIILTEKKCPKCREVKTLNNFYNHIGRSDGKSAHCKICDNGRQKQYNSNNIDKRTAMVSRWKRLNQAKTAASRLRDYEKKKNKADYLLRNRIYWLTRARLKRGEIEKPHSCMFCNTSGRIVAHHPDYNYPKTIIWICLKCHHKVHNEGKLVKKAIEFMRKEARL